ncbi:ABC transporter permease subunit [Labedella populi]|uniref:ABC transporter permease subunit n=1 Tax=Labedella populi TaxID=2498850 RepID=A0A3S4DZ17_9MICO|nr:ABC transporter permease subunit [Labedella populi]RWZ59484.1 ABC transporter permease subunit [Labedella populi]
MELLLQAFSWLLTPESWTQQGGALQRLFEHLGVTIGVVALSAGIALPLGVMIGHTRRWTTAVALLAGAARAIPTLGLLTLLGLALGIGLGAPVLALLVLAAPPLLAGAYAGVQAVDPEAVDGARSVGMSEAEIIRSVELPLALPVIVGGIRSATLQVVATATLAAYTSDTGLGRYIFSGLKSRDYPELIAGSLLVIALALLLDGSFALLMKSRSRAPRSDRQTTTIPLERNPS